MFQLVLTLIVVKRWLKTGLTVEGKDIDVKEWTLLVRAPGLVILEDFRFALLQLISLRTHKSVIHHMVKVQNTCTFLTIHSTTSIM